jgi:hypothetical protein
MTFRGMGINKRALACVSKNSVDVLVNSKFEFLVVVNSLCSKSLIGEAFIARAALLHGIKLPSSGRSYKSNSISQDENQ